MIPTYETTQFKDQGIRTVETFEFQNTRSDVKKYCDHWEKIYQSNLIYQSEAFTYKSYLDNDFADEQVVQYDVPVVVNILTWWLQINDKNDEHKNSQINFDLNTYVLFSEAGTGNKKGYP